MTFQGIIIHKLDKKEEKINFKTLHQSFQVLIFFSNNNKFNIIKDTHNLLFLSKITEFAGEKIINSDYKF